MHIQKNLNRDIIKYLAMLTMFLNHFAHIFLTPQTMLYDVFLNIGYFTAVTICYFLVEGYSYTRSKKRYALRLLIFAILSQVPYILALDFLQLNMLFTLLLCFLILMAMERIQHPALRIVVLVLLVMLSLFCDWALLAPLFTILFAHCKHAQKSFASAFVIAFLLFFFFNLLNYAWLYPLPKALLSSLISGTGILVSGIVILRFYNGQQASYGRVFSKWFFYFFYPVHLTLLYLLKTLLL